SDTYSFFSSHVATRDLHLFPYTTLFRSGARRDHRDGRERLRLAQIGPRRGDTRGLPRPYRAQLGQRGRDGARVQRRYQRRNGERDRKSTRLNSSHVAISYAVFCLKKKKE